MSTNIVRVPLAWPIGTRSGTSLAKDPYIQNGVLEKYGDKLFVSKRPGTVAFKTLGAGGTDQGIYNFNGFFYAVVNDTLYRDSGTANSGTNMTVLIGPIFPQWQARAAFGAVVFKGRMFVIGGRILNSLSDIWQTSDGITWNVNAGGQPWGLRSSMGCVVYNDQIFVVGGYNLTLGSAFNDIWSTSDGAHWKQIQANGGWTSRYRHCCVSTPNGIYIYGGLDNAGADLNDVWFSADGVDWTQVQVAAPWSARDGALGLYFDNRIWLIGGIATGVPQNDVWYSYDGSSWTRSTAAAFATGRYDMCGVVYNGKMWSIAGSVPAVTSQIYSSADGITWTLTVYGTPPGMEARTQAQALVFQGDPRVVPYRYPTIWIMGGDVGGAVVTKTVRWGATTVQTATSYALTPNPLNPVSGQPYQFTTYLNGQVLLIKNQGNLWVLQSGTLTRVTDSNYPLFTVPGIVALNAFLYVMTPQGEIYSCQLDYPLIWPPLQFVTADYENDPAVALAKYLNYVVAFGLYTTQFFYDNGANQPVGSALAPLQNANVRVGCVAALTVQTCGNGLYWVGQGDQGGRSVYTFNGFQPQVVSTPYIDRILMATSATSMIGIAAGCDGREFYILKTGTSTALVYDVTYKEWYEWDTFPYNNYVSDFSTGGDYLFANTGGSLTKMTPASYTDVLSGNFTLKVQTDKQDHGNTARKFFGSAVLMGDSVSSTPSIAATDDDYQTSTTFGTVTMSDNRPRLTRLGSARRRSWIVSQTDNVAARYEALEVEYSQGES